MIIETCPECGADLLNMQIATFPPIQRKECPKCHWSWEGSAEEVIRIPFQPGNPSQGIPKYADMNLIPVYPDIADPIDSTTGQITPEFGKPACRNCSTNPANGGSGICNCTLGQDVIY